MEDQIFTRAGKLQHTQPSLPIWEVPVAEAKGTGG